MINQIKNMAIHFPQAVLANLKYGFPSQKLRIIGVTGTDGKTTTVNMIYQILKDSGRKVSMLSTINAVIGGKAYDTGFHVTTPDSFSLQKYLKLAVQNGDEFMVLEVTSHGLAQYRTWGINFEIGVITNITHEHLDYHGNFENYRLAKTKLIKGVKWAVLNQDDPSFSFLKSQTKAQIKDFGFKKTADLNPQNFGFKLKIPGEYNIYNALAAAAVAEILKIKPQIIKQSLENFKPLPGRMENIASKDFKVIVDFAHTPNALEEALKTLRLATSGKLIAVFGAAAKRDTAKRPIMGKIAAKLADIVILTDEDPRFEARTKIIEEIALGCYEGGLVDGKNLFKEPDRQKAISLGLRIAKKGDTVGIFGKGHERSMNYQGEEKPWSDQQAVRNVLKAQNML